MLNRAQTSAGDIATMDPFDGFPHVLYAHQFSREWLESVLFPQAADLQTIDPTSYPQTLAGKRLFYLFYEPSVRTRVSFEAAFTLLGGSVFGMDVAEHINHAEFQGERLEDRIQTINQYPYHFLLLRHHQEGGARRAAAVSRIPVISAGDGMGEHPTQALVDAYTLWRELGRVDHLNVALVGDLSYERSTTSLAYLLGAFPGVKLHLISPDLLRVREEVRVSLEERGVEFEESGDLLAVARGLDAVYMVRSHTARLEHAVRFDSRPSHYVLDAEVLSVLPAHARVLHPLPRGSELPPDFDSDERIACFRQAGNGLYVRMALLTVLAEHAAFAQ